jgi:hypothetical protein
MSEGAILALRKAIVAFLIGDTVLATLMGGSVRIFDEPPRAAEGVYAVFGNASTEDWSTRDQQGDEQKLDITVWGKAGLASSALSACDRIAEMLDDAPLSMSGQRLIALMVTQTDVRRDRASGLARATVTLKAFTEKV